MPTLKRHTIHPTDEEDATITRQAIEDGTLYTDEELAQFKPLETSSLPKSFKAAVRRGRPKLAAPKVSTTVRFDADIIDYFKAKGKGWQTRMNEALREHIAAQKKRNKA